MQNITYDRLKKAVTIGLPALATLVLTVGATWGLPYTEPIAGTITALGAFGGALLGVSSTRHAMGQNGDQTPLHVDEGDE